MRVGQAWLLTVLLCSVSQWTGAIKDETTLDVSKTLQFVWNILVRYYKEANFGQDPPGIVNR